MGLNSKSKAVSNLVTLSIALLICVIAGELILRGFIEVTPDNNRSLNSFEILPYHIPLEETKEKISGYMSNSINSRLIYNELTGWSPNPGFIGDDSMYIYDSLGIRVGQPADKSTKRNEYQVLLLGDSFTHGDEVFFDDTWGSQLEDSLRESNPNYKVYNLGVSGYGLDQALLRLKSMKKRFTPRLLIVGVTFENIVRNVNILRPVYSPLTQIPFSKPRFILSEGKFKKINNPCLTPDQLMETLTNLNSWKLRKYENLYNSNYKATFLNQSYLYSTVETVFSYLSEIGEIYDLDNEPVSVTTRILREIKNEADSLNAKLLFVDLPNRNDLMLSKWLDYLPYRNVLEMYQPEFEFITTSENFNKNDNSIEDYFMHIHYSGLGNKIAAESILEYLRNDM